MRKLLMAMLAITCLATSCTQPYKKTKSGMEYKVFKGKGGQPLLPGAYFRMEVMEKYEDSVLTDSRAMGEPVFAQYDTAAFPEDIRMAFANLRMGDSIVLRMSTDSIAKNVTLPPFMKKGKSVYSIYTVKEVYASKEKADEARLAFNVKAQEKSTARMEV